MTVAFDRSASNRSAPRRIAPPKWFRCIGDLWTSCWTALPRSGRDAGDSRWRIPFRPDHGHELLDDVGKPAFPGYSAIGRLRGLAEIRGVMTAVASLRGLPV